MHKLLYKKNMFFKHFFGRQYSINKFLVKNSPEVNSKYGLKRYTKRTFLSIILGACFYDGYNSFEVCASATRFLRSLKIATQISMDYTWNLYGIEDGTQKYDQILKEIHLRSAHRILNGCLTNGGLYIKIGQGVSAINHILPYEYTNTLKKLENECLPRKEEEVKKMFQNEFGKPPEDLFAEFDYNSVAAASLAQVFRAKTKDGRDVAVKVQYIDLIKRFSGDFATILSVQKIITIFHKSYNFSWILTDLRKNLEQELDFIHEAQNSVRCAEELSKFDFAYVPKVDWKLTSKRVLTAEWIDGYKISDLEKIKEDNFNIADIDRKLFDIFSEQIFKTGFIHADPHPGNIFLRKDKQGQPQLVLLDHGLYENLRSSVRLSLCKFWEAIVLKDIDKMDKYAKDLHVKDSGKLAEILMQRPINMKAPSFTTRLSDEDIIYFQEDAKRHFDVVLETLKQMPRNMLFVIRNLNTIRAIARQHGDPVDRPIHMAKYAQRCIYNMDNFHMIHKIKWVIRRIKFDFYLFRMHLRLWFIRTYFNTLVLLGRSSPSLNNILNYNFEQT